MFSIGKSNNKFQRQDHSTIVTNSVSAKLYLLHRYYIEIIYSQVASSQQMESQRYIYAARCAAVCLTVI